MPLFPRFLVGITVFLGSGIALAEGWNMPVGVTEVSRQVWSLHMLMFWVCVVIGVIVFGVMFWTMYFHRKSRGAVSAKFTHNTALEVVWTVIPIIILVVLAFPAARTLSKMYDTSAAEVNIKVTGHQ